MADASVQPKRRRLRYSLRYLMIVVAAIAIPLGWKMNRLHCQRAVVAEIEQIGGHVSHQYPELIAQTEPPGPQRLRQIFGEDVFNPVVEIEINDRRLSDQLVERIANLPDLRNLAIISDCITELPTEALRI